jgi:hypothetical protein
MASIWLAVKGKQYDSTGNGMELPE